MPPLSSYLALPPALLALLCQAVANPNPTALKKLSPDPGEKLFPEHLAFAPADHLLHQHSFSGLYTPAEEPDESRHSNATTRFYKRAFGTHFDETDEGIFRRAAEALALLERRSSCPSGMSSCADIGYPNKCCQEGTYCADAPESEDVGNVACCPEGSNCGGGIGDCPSNAVSCPASLGGGCCIPGYICQGIGCVTSTTTTATETEVVTTSEEQSSETITTTRTTTIEGEPSTVIVTLTITRYPSVEPTTKTTTEIVTATETESEAETETETETETDNSTRTATETATGEPPWRPTVTSESGGGDTQTGCPTGFYGCLATHGGGCCRTDRNCETHSCPAPSSTTVVSNGVTIVVPADNVPTAVSTCADGWFLCGDSGGPVPGCCPRGYECATASCYNETVAVQKELPDNDASPSVGKWRLIPLAAVGSAVMFLMV